MSNNVVTELAPTGTLRAAINLANFLLVSSRAETGAPQGVAPALALRASGSHLGFESNWEHALLFARYVVVGQAI